MTDKIEVTQADLDCWKAIFGFTNETIDAEGADKRGIELLARHRIDARKQALEEAEEALAIKARRSTSIVAAKTYRAAADVVRALSTQQGDTQ